MAVKPWLGAIK